MARPWAGRSGPSGREKLGSGSWKGRWTTSSSTALFLGLLNTCLLVLPTKSARTYRDKEYCEAETFRASCSINEVVVMDRARYGRMELGRCVIRDYGYVGCEADVLPHLDSRCSGRRKCEIRIPDSTLDRANPCPKDFKTYLKASYGCIPVHTPTCRTCRNATYIQAESRGGYIASVLTEETGCGRKSCPWVLRARPGQRLNITLLDFALSTRHRNQPSGAGLSGGTAGSSATAHLGLPEVCYTYATLREPGKDKPFAVCGSRDRLSTAYVSDSNEVQIEVAEGKRGGNFGYFLLMYEMIGCSEFEPPINTWMKRNGQVLTIGCVATGETWEVTCRESAWTGDVGTCPHPPDDVAYPSSSEDAPSLPVGILITIILAIAMVIGVLILTVGLVMIKRRRQQQPCDRPLHPATPSSDLYYKEGHSTMRSSGFSTMEQKKYAQYKDKKFSPGSHLRQQENEYAYNLNMELRPLPSIPNVNEADDAVLAPTTTSGPSSSSSHTTTMAMIVPSGGVPMFGPHGEGAYHHAGPHSPLGPPDSAHIPSYDHTYFTAPSENGSVGPHYFELDPDGMPLPPPPPPSEDFGPIHSPLLNGGGAGGVAYPPRPPVPSLRPLHHTGPGHKSPEQENAENFGKEGFNTSCQDVASPVPVNGQIPYQESGTCSWP